MKFRRKKKKSKAAYEEDASRRSDPVLKLNLDHGDVMIMSGAGIQTHFEHAVVPEGMRIAATARYIQSS